MDQSDEVFAQLEEDYRETKIINVVQRRGIPSVTWDPRLSENDVVATLVKALLFMTIDEFLSDIFEEDEGGGV